MATSHVPKHSSFRKHEKYGFPPSYDDGVYSSVDLDECGGIYHGVVAQHLCLREFGEEYFLAFFDY